MRGEYEDYLATPRGLVELPPRARRIPEFSAEITVPCGTTSACAENTNIFRAPANRTWNYLRVRGEYANSLDTDSFSEELPPRARRIPWILHRGKLVSRTTSACAENTPRHRRNRVRPRNYLRVRGEYPCYRPWRLKDEELPPRARRIPPPPASPPSSCGTTSACAENTFYH